MITRTAVRLVLLTAFVSMLGVPAYAQATQCTKYEPSVGQAGKDVVWVPTPQPLVDKMLDMAKVTPQDFLMDLGSGDGRTVVTAAKRGLRAQGVEFNPDMVTLAKCNATAAGVADRAIFVQGDIFETDFSKASVITLFLLPTLNEKLRPTILKMKPGTRIVSNAFAMGDWQPDQNETIQNCTQWCTAMLWIVPARRGRHVAGRSEHADHRSELPDGHGQPRLGRHHRRQAEWGRHHVHGGRRQIHRKSRRQNDERHHHGRPRRHVEGDQALSPHWSAVRTLAHLPSGRGREPRPERPNDSTTRTPLNDPNVPERSERSERPERPNDPNVLWIPIPSPAPPRRALRVLPSTSARISTPGVSSAAPHSPSIAVRMLTLSSSTRANVNQRRRGALATACRNCATPPIRRGCAADRWRAPARLLARPARSGSGSAARSHPPPGVRQIVIDYATSPDAAALQWLAPEQTAGRRHPFLFSQGQAILTRTWIPTQDSPGIRQTYYARIVVPRGLRALMSAESLTPDGIDIAEGRSFEFQLTTPVPPYLIALAVGDLRFASLGAAVGRVCRAGDDRGRRVRVRRPGEDARRGRGALGPYRWGRYDVLVLPPTFPFGGMENPRLTFATPTILAGDRRSSR